MKKIADLYPWLVAFVICVVFCACQAVQNASDSAYKVIPPGKYAVDFEFDDGSGKAYKGGVSYEKDEEASKREGREVLLRQEDGTAAGATPTPTRIRLRPASANPTKPATAPQTSSRAHELRLDGLALVVADIPAESIIEAIKASGGGGSWAIVIAILIAVAHLELRIRPLGVEILTHERAQTRKLGITDDELAIARSRAEQDVPHVPINGAVPG